MAACFARRRLSIDEEEAMVAWRLMPQFKNEVWWNNLRAFDDWAEKRTWLLYENCCQEKPNKEELDR